MADGLQPQKLIAPAALLAAAESPDEAALAANIVLAAHDNALLYQELVWVWAKAALSTPGHPLAELAREVHCANSVLPIGAAARALALDRAALLQWDEAPEADPVVSERLGLMLAKAAAMCTYEKRGDEYVFGVLRLMLEPERDAVLCGETPYQAITAQYGASANDIVRPMLDQMPSTIVAGIDASSPEPAQLVRAMGLLYESLDGDCGRVRINADLFHGDGLVAFRNFGQWGDGFGYRVGTTVYVGHPVFPLASTLLGWAQHSGTRAFDELHLALTNPGAVPPDASIAGLLK